jgi:tetratricopeptide (TPR) repeat protein
MFATMRKSCFHKHYTIIIDIICILELLRSSPFLRSFTVSAFATQSLPLSVGPIHTLSISAAATENFQPPGGFDNLLKAAELAIKDIRYEQAERFLKAARTIAADSKRSDLTVATIHDYLAKVYIKQARYDDAEAPYQMSLSIRERLLAPTDHEILVNLNDLLVLYLLRKKFDQAEPICNKLLHIYRIGLGDEHPEVGKCLHNLGMVYKEQYRYAEAVKLFQKSLSIMEESLGPVHPEVGMRLADLATLYQKQGKLQEAENVFHRALTILEACLSHTDLKLGTLLQNLVINLNAQGKDQEIEQYQKRLLQIKELNLPPGHPDVIIGLEQLANYHFLQRNFDEAERLLKRVQAIKERIYPNQLQVAATLVDLALVSHNKGNFKRAEALLKQVLTIQEKLLPKFGSTQLSTVHRLASLYTCNRRYVESEPYWRRLLVSTEKLYGIHSTQVCESLRNLALASFKIGKYDQSERLWKRLQDIRECSDSPSLRDLSLSAHYLAEIARLRNDTEKAEKLFMLAIDLKTKAFGSKHKEVAVSLEAYARLLGSTYREEAAEHMRACANAIRRALRTKTASATQTLELTPLLGV